MTATELPLISEFTSDASKFAYHTEQMDALRRGEVPGPISSFLMIHDGCNHTCAFCSTLTREGDTLPFDDLQGYLDILCKLGLKATIISGGGNPILYKDKKSGKNFDDVVDSIHARGLQIGLYYKWNANERIPLWKEIMENC